MFLPSPSSTFIAWDPRVLMQPANPTYNSQDNNQQKNEVPVVCKEYSSAGVIARHSPDFGLGSGGVEVMLHRHCALGGEVLVDQLGVGVQSEQVRCAVHNVVGSQDYAGVSSWKQKRSTRTENW